MDRLSFEFQKEVHKVRELQSQLALHQQEMATIAYQLYSATYLQSIYRGYKARKIRKHLLLQRFLKNFIVFRLRWRKLRRAQIVIAHFFRHCVLGREFFRLIQYCTAAIKIQRKVRQSYLSRRAIIRTLSFRLWNHVELFAITKAKRKLQPLEKHRYILNAFIGGYMRRKRLLRLGNKLSCFRIFYSLFHLTIDSDQTRPHQQAIDSNEHLIHAHETHLSPKQIEEMKFKFEEKKNAQSRQELLSFLKKSLKVPSETSPDKSHKKTLPDLLSKEVKMNPNKKYQSVLDPISLLHNEISGYPSLIPTPFILSHHYRLRSLRETTLFLFDLKQKTQLYPEAVESPPPLLYAANTPKMKRAMSDAITRKISLNVKLIPPSIRPFHSETLQNETLIKKESERLAGLRKIHLLRNMRSTNSGPQQQQTNPPPAVLPKPPPVPKTLVSSRLINARQKNGLVVKTTEKNLLIPKQQINEKLYQKIDELSFVEMRSAPHTAEGADPMNGGPLGHDHDPEARGEGERQREGQGEGQGEGEDQEYSDTESESSNYSQDDDFEYSNERMKPLRPSQPPPSFFKRRQNIAIIPPILSLDNIQIS